MQKYQKEMADRIDAMTIKEARIAIASGGFGDIGSQNHAFASSWLAAKEARLREAREAEIAALLRSKAVNEEEAANATVENFALATAWQKIEEEYGVSKKAFGKKINFIQERFRRQIIFRDIGQAFVLAREGFNKPSVVLAGSVIEEMLRLFLGHKNITPARNTLDSYIKACEENGLLKAAIHRLADSVRQFRNIVHLEKEASLRHTISKATAIGAVTSIFTIANDFE